jgi:nucleoside-diphosphate-sugar epimerase
MLRTVVITGATGFIGGVLSRKLLERGVSVYGVGRNQRKLAELSSYPGFTAVPLDFENYADLPGYTRGKAIDAFFHLAWQAFGASSDDAEIQLNNVAQSVKSLRMAAELGVGKFVMAGSYYQYKIAPITTERNGTSEEGVKYDSIFGIAKTCAVEMCRNLADKYSIPFTNCYIPKVFGPGDNEASAPVKIVRQLIKNAPVQLTAGDSLDDWVYVEDVAEGIIAAASGGGGGTYYIGNRDLRPFSDIITDMKAALNSDSELVFGSYPDCGHIDYTKLNLDRLYKDTGFECKVDFSVAVRELAVWIGGYECAQYP